MKPLRTAFRLWLCTLLLTLTAGCWQDEEFSTAPTDLLRFSTDSVNFDTVISGQPTNTRTFMVYNPNARSLRISRAFLGRGTESVFRVNIDGTFLENGEASNFELYAEDSLRVFLEMTAPVSDSDEPVAVEDELTFVLESGQTQSVTLTAYGQDVVVLKGWTVTADTTLTARRPYQVYDSLVVAPDVTLNLPAGARLYFHPDARLIVHGTLRAEGALGNEVMMRGDRMGNMFSNQPYDLIPGQWGGIVLTSGSYGNIFNYCDIHSGSFGLRCDSADVSREKVRIENSVLHNVSGDVLTARACSLFVGNSQLTNAGGNCVTLYGGSSRFVHLITGYGEDEIMGAQSADHADLPFNYLFRNCLLDTPEFVDEQVQNCLWDNDEAAVWREGNFSPAFDLDRLLFRFSLDSLSSAVGNADPTVTQTYYPYDRLGRSRLDDGRSDIGCYELLEVGAE